MAGDMINHPNHYQMKNGLEVIEIIDAVTDVKAYCKGNIIKYVCREDKKNGIEDLKKADWYIQYLIDYKQKELKGEIDAATQEVLNKHAGN